MSDTTETTPEPRPPATLDDVRELLETMNSRDERDVKRKGPGYSNTYVAAMTQGDFRHAAVSRLTMIAFCVGLLTVLTCIGVIYAAKQYGDAKKALENAGLSEYQICRDDDSKDITDCEGLDGDPLA